MTEFRQNLFRRRLYPILDRDSCLKYNISMMDLPGMWVDSGIHFFQLRAKEISSQEYLDLSRSLKIRYPNAHIIANDFVALALDFPELFSGVHLGQEDFQNLDTDLSKKLAERCRNFDTSGYSNLNEGFIAGLSTHDLGQVQSVIETSSERSSDMPDWSYIAIGPMSPTNSKPTGSDPVLGEREREEIFQYLGEKYIQANQEKKRKIKPNIFIVLIGGLTAARLDEILPPDFITSCAFFPLVAVIGSGMEKLKFKQLLDKIDTYIT